MKSPLTLVDDSFVLTRQRPSRRTAVVRTVTVNSVRWLLTGVVTMAAALPCWVVVSLGGALPLLGALAFLGLPVVLLDVSARRLRSRRADGVGGCALGGDRDTASGMTPAPARAHLSGTRHR